MALSLSMLGISLGQNFKPNRRGSVLDGAQWWFSVVSRLPSLHGALAMQTSLTVTTWRQASYKYLRVEAVDAYKHPAVQGSLKQQRSIWVNMSGEQEEEHLGLSYFSLTLKRNIIRETTYVGKSSQLESTAHPDREFTTAGAGGGWSHDPHSQDTERDGCQCSVLFHMCMWALSLSLGGKFRLNFPSSSWMCRELSPRWLQSIELSVKINCHTPFMC